MCDCITSASLPFFFHWLHNDVYRLSCVPSKNTFHSSETAGGRAVNSLVPPADQESLNISRRPIDRRAPGRRVGHAARACASIRFSNQQLDCQRIQGEGDKQTARLCPRQPGRPAPIVRPSLLGAVRCGCRRTPPSQISLPLTFFFFFLRAEIHA